jgi:hypothetical protein
VHSFRFPDEMLHQGRDVVWALLQRRKPNSGRRNSLREIGAKPTYLNQLRKILVAGGYQSECAAAVGSRSYGPELTGFNRPEQFRLYHRREAAYLIEEQRAIVCFGKVPSRVRNGASERSAHVPKEGVLEHRV